MLGVILIITVLLSLVGPAVTSLNQTNLVSKAVYDIAGLLEQARAYAMANSTYVYVGFFESSASASESAVPQPSGVGRLNVAVIARKDGTRAYTYSSTDPTIVPTSWNSAYPNGTAPYGGNFLTVGKVQHFTNLHLVSLGTPPLTGGMYRPKLVAETFNGTSETSDLGDMQNCNPKTPFDYPLGSAIGTGTYSFTRVIQYDPQGVARIQQALNTDAISHEIEIGLEQTYGTVAASLPSTVSSGDVAAIQIDGMTGSTHIYRP